MKTNYLELLLKKKNFYKVLVIAVIMCAIAFVLYQIGVVIYVLIKVIVS